jgi:acyl-CoA dehydrogenase
MSKDLYLTPNDNNPAAKVSSILAQVIAVEPLEKKLNAAHRDYPADSKTRAEWMITAKEHHVITAEEATLLNKVFAEKMNVIHVDDFGAELV